MAWTRLVHGDTAMTPDSPGTWGWRAMVMAGGAVARRLPRTRRAERHGSVPTSPGPSPRTCVSKAASVVGPSGEVSLADNRPHLVPTPAGSPARRRSRRPRATAGYKPAARFRHFRYAAHVLVVAVDPDLGGVEILDYVIVEDGGVRVNPLIVDGQILGGLAQGIGTALFEEMLLDAAGQPQASTFADYLLPGAPETPVARIDHMETAIAEYGVRGQGHRRGGAIAPPAAIANAVNDALGPLGVELLHSPLTPRRIVEAVLDARPNARRRAAS